MGEMPCLTLLASGGRKYCRLRLHRTPEQSFGKGQKREGVQKASHVLEVNAAMERRTFPVPTQNFIADRL
jgi:hypothetical protein